LAQVFDQPVRLCNTEGPLCACWVVAHASFWRVRPVRGARARIGSSGALVHV